MSKNIFIQTECLMLNGRPQNPKYIRNKNLFFVSGSGKTRLREVLSDAA